MITGATQQQLRTTTPTAIYSARGNDPGQSLPVSGARIETTKTNLAAVDVETALSLAGVSRKYDVRNVSPREMAAMSQELYQGGAISFQDHALLSFQPELSPEFNKIFPGRPGKPDTPRDFIAQWETQLQTDEKRSDKNASKNDQRIQNIIGNLAALRESTAER